MIGDASTPPPASLSWKAALLEARTQIADYEREGTSTPGKLKRAARLRASRLALRDFAAGHEQAVARLKDAFNQIERADKDDNWRRVGELIQAALVELDGLI
ncbi:MAG: hypothetical protein ACRD1E_00890, partial [Terriglobales bacterium]